METRLNSAKRSQHANWLLIAAILLGVCRSNGQVTFTAPLLQDTYINSATGASTPTATDIRMSEAATALRGLIQFDLSSIPYGSTIMSANFSFLVFGIPVAVADRGFQIQYCPQTWNESTVTWTTQPWANDNTITDMPLVIPVTAALTSFNISVTSHVRYMVERKLNYGWMLRKVNANGTITLASNENASVSSRPKLVVQYYLPVNITVSTVPATTGSASDGSADISVSGGSGSFTYQWYDAAGAALVATQDIASRPAGLYKLTVTDATTARVYTQYVVIGNLQAAITVTMQPDETYSMDANVLNPIMAITLPPPSAIPFRNYPSDAVARSGQTTSNNYRSLIKFSYLGLEENNNITVESATLSLFGATHANGPNGTSFKISRITQPWFEDCVTWLNQPAVTTVHEKTISPGPNNTTPNVFCDITDMAQFHSQSPIQQNGYMLNWFSTGSSFGTNNYDNFHSSGSATTLSRPMLTVRLRVRKDYCELKPKPDGSMYSVYTLLRFRYTEDYKDSDGQLSYAIYKLQDNSVVLTQSGVPLAVQPGDNRYVLNLKTAGLLPGAYMLEVTNEKKQLSYLRFTLN